MDKKKIKEEIAKILLELPSIARIVFYLAEKTKDGNYKKTDEVIASVLFTISDKELTKKFIKFLQCKDIKVITNKNDSGKCTVYSNETKCQAEAVAYVRDKVRENIKEFNDPYVKKQLFLFQDKLKNALDFMELTEEKYLIMNSEIKIINNEDEEKFKKLVEDFGKEHINEKFLDFLDEIV